MPSLSPGFRIPQSRECRRLVQCIFSRAKLSECVDLLKELKTDDARCFFAGATFRRILDGYYAEEFLEESLFAEENNRELHCLPAGDSEHAK